MNRVRRLRLAATWVGAISGLLLATAFGWFLNDWLGSDEVVVKADRPVEIYAPETVVAGKLPNVVGLNEADARRVLSDAGVELDAVSVRPVPYVGPTDLVVRQSPASGERIGARKVVLAVSTTAEMPELAGATEARARAELSTLGARIAVVGQYQPGAAEGTVLSMDPPAGERIEDRATLHVAEPLSSIFLTQLTPASASCRTEEPALIAGEAAKEAIVCLPQPGANPRSVTYAIGGEVESLRAKIGLDDEGNSEVPVEFRVIADGERVFSRRLSFGNSTSIDVSLLGRVQIRLEAVAIGGAASGSQLPVRAAFGEPQLVGSRSAIDRISEGLTE